ncbi:hypothetical protein ACH4PU_27810 [Streptomyces sp. NPDC021100]|uniref:hypothetical protein n=1 Tax=Streptomyces sp. NPDC021100 TaxID=3365114 RepID=UPI003797F5EF
MTKNPRQSALRRSGKGATSQDSAAAKADPDHKAGPGGPERAHGTDKGTKGGGRGGGVPPGRRPDHP